MKNNEERTTKTVEKNGLIISEDGKVLIGVNDNSIMSIEIPDGIEVIGAKAFNDCSLLREVSLPQSVRQISEDAFLSNEFCRAQNEVPNNK